MGIDHQPTPGPNENDGTGSLTQEFSLFLKSDPMRAQKLVFELSISRFCYEVGSFGNISPKDLARFFSTKRPHKTVKEIRDFFEPCFGGGEEELRKRLEVVCSAIESTVPEHVALSKEAASLIKEALCKVLLRESALCIGSHKLPQIILDTGLGIDKSIIKPFSDGVEIKKNYILQTNLSEKSPKLKREKTNLLLNKILEDSNIAKTKINSCIDSLLKLFKPLTAHYIERLHYIVPPALNEYLQQPYEQNLTEFTRTQLERTFKADVYKIHQQKFYYIDATLKMLRNSMR
jgi:hypothetical protein